MEKKKQFMEIVYKDALGKIQEVIIPLPEDDFMKGASYRENVDGFVDEIMEGGGFWLNATTIIPFHKIQSFHTHQQKSQPLPKQKPKSNRHRRGTRADKTDNGRGIVR